MRTSTCIDCTAKAFRSTPGCSVQDTVVAAVQCRASVLCRVLVIRRDSERKVLQNPARFRNMCRARFAISRHAFHPTSTFRHAHAYQEL